AIISCCYRYNIIEVAGVRGTETDRQIGGTKTWQTERQAGANAERANANRRDSIRQNCSSNVGQNEADFLTRSHFYHAKIQIAWEHCQLSRRCNGDVIDPCLRISAEWTGNCKLNSISADKLVNVRKVSL